MQRYLLINSHSDSLCPEVLQPLWPHRFLVSTQCCCEGFILCIYGFWLSQVFVPIMGNVRESVPHAYLFFIRLPLALTYSLSYPKVDMNTLRGVQIIWHHNKPCPHTNQWNKYYYWAYKHIYFIQEKHKKSSTFGGKTSFVYMWSAANIVHVVWNRLTLKVYCYQNIHVHKECKKCECR